ncbi:hypothetical protein [Streptomyces europaeiscabiei]|uniref:hypothetical protein n=1 Tax=Streptomyces europaeiscabiei TaxID=146819 RepID=UPI0029AC3F40|nr:hypothetical protein [Streptomyces europaeiscabiei]MDX3835648.1 hypothetical protein [Streptomyces europaeiscabiei]
MRDALLFLGCWLGLGILAAVLFSRHARRRPYLAARWDDAAKDWVNEAEHDVGPDPLKVLDDITTHLKAYGAEIADYYEPVRTGDHTTTHHEGEL